MEKLKNVALTCFLGLVILGCGKDDPAPGHPVIASSSPQFKEGVYNVVFGVTRLNIEIKGSTPQGFGKLVVTKEIDGVVSQIATLSKNDVVIKSSNFEYDLEYESSANEIRKQVVLKAAVTDSKGNISSTNLGTINSLRPLKTYNLSQDTDDSETNIFDYKYFVQMYLTETGILSSEIPFVLEASPEDLNKSKEYAFVNIVFDYNPSAKIGLPQGAYFASPTAVASANAKLVQNFSVKNETLFKISEYSSLSTQDQAAINALTANDPHVLVDLFNRLSASANPQLVFLNKPSSYFVIFKTNTGHVGLIDQIDLALATKVNYRLRLGTRP